MYLNLRLDHERKITLAAWIFWGYLISYSVRLFIHLSHGSSTDPHATSVLGVGIDLHALGRLIKCIFLSLLTFMLLPFLLSCCHAGSKEDLLHPALRHHHNAICSCLVLKGSRNFVRSGDWAFQNETKKGVATQLTTQEN